MVISDYYKSLDKKAKKSFREKVIDVTGMAYPTLYRKLRCGFWTKSEITVITPLMINNERAAE